MWYTHIYTHMHTRTHTHTHTEILLRHKKEWNNAFCPVTWMGLEIIIVSEVNWTKKFIHCTTHLKLVLRVCLLPWVGSKGFGGFWAKEWLDQIFFFCNFVEVLLIYIVVFNICCRTKWLSLPVERLALLWKYCASIELKISLLRRVKDEIQKKLA